MKVFLVSYDLKSTTKDYTPFYNELKKKTWWHYLGSTWLIHTDETATVLYNRLCHHITRDDRLLVIEAGRDRQGWLPEEAWKWIREKLESTT
jgi:hypothetical protein